MHMDANWWKYREAFDNLNEEVRDNLPRLSSGSSRFSRDQLPSNISKLLKGALVLSDFCKKWGPGSIFLLMEEFKVPSL